MLNLCAWWNGLDKGARARWLEAHRLKASIAIYTWRCLKAKERQRIENAARLDAALAG